MSPPSDPPPKTPSDTDPSTSGEIQHRVAFWILELLKSALTCAAVAAIQLAHFLYERLTYARQCLTELPPGVAPRLHYRPSSLSQHVLRNVPGLRQKFRPPLWASGAHAQMGLAALLLAATERTSSDDEREYFQLQDDGVVMLEWIRAGGEDGTGSCRAEAASVVLVVAGPCTWPAIRHFRQVEQQSGSVGRLQPSWTVVLHGRGMAGTPLTTARLHSVGDASDLAQVVLYIRDQCPRSRLAAIGYGLGNAPLFSYLGDSGSSSQLGVAVAISPVWDVPHLFSSDSSDSNGKWLLLAQHKLQLLRHAAALASTVRLGPALLSANLDEFYAHVHLNNQPPERACVSDCPSEGAADMTAYWELHHPMRDVDDVSVPLLVVASRDDPMIAAPPDDDGIPYDLFGVYPNFLLALTEAGGHCGFVEGDEGVLRPRAGWAARLALDYIAAVWDFQDQFDPFVDQGGPMKIEIVCSDDEDD